MGSNPVGRATYEQNWALLPVWPPSAHHQPFQNVPSSVNANLRVINFDLVDDGTEVGGETGSRPLATFSRIKSAKALIFSSVMRVSGWNSRRRDLGRPAPDHVRFSAASRSLSVGSEPSAIPFSMASYSRDKTALAIRELVLQACNSLRSGRRCARLS